jgi:hypothetical protein
VSNLLGSLLATSLLVATPAAELHAALEAVLDAGGYQQELPLDSGAAEAEPGAGPSSLWLWLAAAPLSVVARALLWTLLVVALLLGGLWIARRWQGRAPPLELTAHAMAAAAAAHGPAGGAWTVAAAEALARERRFAQAIHVLLLHGLDELSRRLELAPRPSLTSRELVARSPLGDEGRGALLRILRTAELGHFGGRDLGPEEYAACLEQFHRFLGACHRQAP